MSDYPMLISNKLHSFRNFVLQKKHKKSSTSMTKISIKSGKLTSFGGIFLIMEQFDSMLSSVINSTL